MKTLDIHALLARHRETFGSARMETPPPTPPVPTPPPSPTPPAPTYEAPASQADLDRIINERLTRERAKYADHADLKVKAARLDKIEADNASDLEKAVTAARAEGATSVTEAANARLVKSEARALAAAAKARNPLVAVNNLDLSGVKVDGDGTVDAAAIKTLIDDLVKSDPYLFGDEAPPPPPPFNGGPRVPSSTPLDPRAADLAQIEADIKAGQRR